MFDSNTIIANLPHLPGVYRMLNKKGEVLYVGKARDLKKRVASYFQKAQHGPRISIMLNQVADVETTVTRSEAEALLLENNLIKTLAPRYNILFRDDKSYPYIIVTGHAFPRIGFYRGALDKKQHQYFGPYPSAYAVRESIQLLQKMFRLRTCEDSIFQNRTRPCLLYQIKRCSGPCVKLIDTQTYRDDVDNAIFFLEGKYNQVVKSLEKKMKQAADQRDYESAAALRDQIQSLRRVHEKQYITSERDSLDADIIAGVVSSGMLCVNLVMVRGGRHLGDKSFFPANAENYSVEEALDAFITQHYLQRVIPPLIVVNKEFDTQALQQVFSEQAGYRVKIQSHPSGESKVWLEMAEKNAWMAIGQRLNQQTTQEGRLAALREVLDLPDTAKRIECFDVSHTFGEATVASCVVFDDGKMQNAQYRQYNIQDIKANDDYGAMRNVLNRRYSKLAAGEGLIPDLILIDGGKGQVNAAKEVLAELGLSDLFIVGVAKGEGRKPGLEKLVFADERQPLQLESNHPALHLIQQIRDEAHRFAITRHRAKRSKARNVSPLEQLANIGPKRRQKILTYFGGLKGVMNATAEELAQVDGISQKLAEEIYRALH